MVRPQLGILLLVALVPYDGLLVIVPHPLVLQGWKEALTVLVILASFVAPASVRGRPGRRLPPWTAALAAFIAVGTVSAVAVGDLNGLYGLKVYFFFVLAAIAVWRCPLNRRERDALVAILMVNGVLTGAWGVVQQLVGADRLHEMGYPFNSVIRFTGDFLRSFSTFETPFGFGYFEMVVLLVCLPVALADVHRRRNTAFLVLSPLIIGGMLSSVVRGAWLGLAVGLVYLAVQRFPIRVVVVSVGIAVLLGFAAPLFLPADVARPAFQSRSVAERVTKWTDHMGEIADHPLGAGIGTTGSPAEKVDELHGREVATFQPDNHYFLVGYELGFPGLLCFAVLLALVARATWRVGHRLSGDGAAFAQGTGAFTIGAAAASVMATFFQIFPMDVLWWVCVGVVSTMAPTSESTAEATPVAAAPTAGL